MEATTSIPEATPVGHLPPGQDNSEQWSDTIWQPFREASAKGGERLHELKKQISILAIEKKQLEQGWVYFCHTHPTEVKIAGIAFGNLLAYSAAVHNYWLPKAPAAAASVMLVQALIGGCITLQSLTDTSWNIFTGNRLVCLATRLTKIDLTLESLEKHTRLVESSLRTLEDFHIEFRRIEKFRIAWKTFVNEPQEEQVGKLFKRIVVIATENKRSRFSKTTTTPSRSDNLCLFLMEDVCRVFKNSTLARRWETLKKTPLADFWNDYKVEAWARLGVNHPSPNQYAAFFKALKSYDDAPLADRIASAFENKLACFLEKGFLKTADDYV